MKLDSQKGFTLIELLVVIAIIAILATIILVALNSGRAKARDAKRISDLRTIASLLDVYFQDNGHYPINDTNSSAFYANDCDSSPNWIPNIDPATKKVDYTWSSPYISQIPHDPSQNCSDAQNPFNSGSGTAEYAYGTDSTGSWYQLIARLEDSNNPKTIKNSGQLDCNGKQFSATPPTGDGWNPQSYVIESC